MVQDFHHIRDHLEQQGDDVALPSFHVSELSEQALRLNCDVQPEELALAPEEALVHGGLALSLSIAAFGTHVRVQGAVGGVFVRECVRCLTKYEQRMDVPFVADYRMPEGLAGRGRSPGVFGEDVIGLLETPDSDEDVYVCTGERVDLADMLREQIILATPMQPLCHEHCRGLCPVCGRDRNQGACGCVELPPMNPFAVLQQRWKKPK